MGATPPNYSLATCRSHMTIGSLSGWACRICIAEGGIRGSEADEPLFKRPSEARRRSSGPRREW